MRILLLESKNKRITTLNNLLKKNSYQTDVASGEFICEQLAEIKEYDLIILNCKQNETNDWNTLQNIRKKGINAFIIILLADDSVDNRIKALDSGADDYLTQPYSFEELLAKLRACERRINHPDIQNETLSLASLSFVPSKGELSYENETLLLTPRESKLLELLLRNKNQVMTKEQLFEKIWGLTSDAEINCIEVYLSYLRKKLKQLNCPVTIENIRGMGYFLKEK
jgi:DNA-binding response OmpR family regulator